MDDRINIATGDDVPRPMEGLYLRDALKRLALINAIATSLRYDLEPLTAEEVELGAEPLDREQISEELNRISEVVTSFALEELRAKPDEWLKACDSIP